MDLTIKKKEEEGWGTRKRKIEQSWVGRKVELDLGELGVNMIKICWKKFKIAIKTQEV